MYEQSLGIHSCVCGEIYPSLAPESSSPRRTREPDSYVYGHLKGVDVRRSKYIKEVTMLEIKKNYAYFSLMRFLVLMTAKIKVTCPLA
jgi:hypothetical protein